MDFIQKVIDYFKDNMPLSIILAAIALIVIVLIIVLIVAGVKKSKKKKSASAAAADSADTDTEDTPPSREENKTTPVAPEAESDDGDTPASKQAAERQEIAASEPARAEQAENEAVPNVSAQAEPSDGEETAPHDETPASDGETPASDGEEPAPLPAENISERDDEKSVSQDKTAESPAPGQDVKKPAETAPGQDVKKPAAMPPEQDEDKRYAGKWVIRKNDETDAYHFELLASNGEKLLSSIDYTSVAGARGGIKTHKANIAKDNFTIATSKSKQYFFKLLSGTKQILCTGETYKTKSRCESAIESVKRFAETAVIVVEKTDGEN
ncbi:MAG TPA: DUF1508 domain-containing protein [Candidatus Borkfalkia stercoripullorum]|nr:DUF1508 domain-containing protein [Candidatus Borkfalkia stercoripullorum]